MHASGEKIVHLLFHRGWITSFSLIIFLTLSLHFLISLLNKKLIERLEKTQLAWNTAFLKALIFPLKFLIWVLAISFSFEVLSDYFHNNTCIAFFKGFRLFATIFLFLWIALRFTKNMEMHYLKEQKEHKKPYDKTTVRAICQLLRIALILVAVLVYLQTYNINISAVLAFGGAGGIVVGLAAKDLLANFFGGLMIYLDRPFSVGEWIRSPDREIEGHVEMIGWRLTQIRTFSKRLLYVPNGVFSNISVENPSRMSNRQIKTQIGIRYEDASKMSSIIDEIEGMLRAHPEIDLSKVLMVRFNEFGTSSLNFLVYCFTKTTKWADYLMIQQQIYLKIIKIIEKHGAQCAFQKNSIHFPEGIQIQKAPKP